MTYKCKYNATAGICLGISSCGAVIEPCELDKLPEDKKYALKRACLNRRALEARGIVPFESDLAELVSLSSSP